MTLPQTLLSPQPGSRPQRWNWRAIVLLLLILVVIGSQLGFYTIQPIGTLPEGRTVLIWRAAGEPPFNSPDAECLRIQQGVSLLCRMAALSQAPTNRIIFRLPYMEWAYLLSTNGQSFDR